MKQNRNHHAMESSARDRCRRCPCRYYTPPCVPCPPCPPPAPPASASFTLIKRDRESGAALAGAHYALYQNGQAVASAQSDAEGILSFRNLAPGEYELREIQPPVGYQAEAGGFLPVVVALDGTVTAGGRPAEGQSVYDVALSRLAFIKRNALDGAPLAGAVFTLSNGMSVTSDSDGLVDFGTLAPGTYTMRETAVPPGYLPVSTTFNITVAGNGSITVDGTPLSEFSVSNERQQVSPQPQADPLIEGANFVLGNGVPGAAITVTYPNGVGVTTTVNENGIWLIPVPAGIRLNAGDVVRVVQTVSGALPSESVDVVVIASA